MRRSMGLAPLLLLLLAAPSAAAEPVEVAASVYVINVGNYDSVKGTYVIDMYLTLSWDVASAPENFTAARFEFMNGRASALERIVDETDADGRRTLTYRIQANLYSEPRFEEYPYDVQLLEVLFEDQTKGVDELVYVPVEEESLLDERVRIAGWRLLSQGIEAGTKDYPPDEHFSRVRFALELQREPLSSTLKSFLPPVAFMVVASLGFFFHPSKVANRITLGTGMLISAVGFHISQTASLPPMGSLILFDKVMIATYAFIVGCLIVSTLIHIDEDYWKDRDHTKPINIWGAVATVVATLVLFVGLVAL